MKPAIVFLGVFLCLTGCEFKIDVRSKLPSLFPIKEQVYSKAIFLTCAVSVYALEDSFGEIFTFQMLEKDNAKKLENYRPFLNSSYEPWQKTPIWDNIGELSHAGGALITAPKCMPDYYRNLLIKYSTTKAGYFTSFTGEVMIYAPEENLLIFTAWD